MRLRFRGRRAGLNNAYESGRFAVLAELEEVIAQREVERPEGAYTTYLFDKG